MNGMIRGPMIITNIHVHTVAGDYTVVNNTIVVVNKASGAATAVNLPAGATYRKNAAQIAIVDGKGDAASNNITITPNGADTINGASSLVMNLAYQSVWLSWNGTEWNVLGMGATGGGAASFTAITATSLAATAGIKSSGPTGAGIGYATGAGGAVTQITSRTTGVTLSKLSGAITLVSAAGSATPATFIVTNTTVAATDIVLLTQKSGTDVYTATAVAGAGSFTVTIVDLTGTTTEAPVFNYAIFKAVAA